jgi:hypothetical protein
VCVNDAQINYTALNLPMGVEDLGSRYATRLRPRQTRLSGAGPPVRSGTAGARGGY